MMLAILNCVLRIQAMTKLYIVATNDADDEHRRDLVDCIIETATEWQRLDGEERERHRAAAPARAEEPQK